MNFEFDPSLAFSRNIGWLSPLEQSSISEKCVAIAGMGGVGGIHLLTLVRLGVSNFKISDFDSFEIENFNRQVGANCSTVGKPKAQVLKDMAIEINPLAKIEIFEKISKNNIDNFLDDVDLYVDGLDFFAVDARELVFSFCHQKKIPAITTAPIGMGTNFLIFKDKMSFMDYFDWHGKTRQQKLINFMLGLCPKPMHLKYLIIRDSINFDEEKGPSTIMACQLCAGVAATEALKILLNRGKIYQAPYVNQLDAYRGKLKRSYILFGLKNPIQKFKATLIKRSLYKERVQKTSESDELSYNQAVYKVLNKARWAPSGDNLQPWRFEIHSDKKFTVKPHSKSKPDFYNFDGKPTLTSIGCLIESIFLAANQLAYHSDFEVNSKTGAVTITLSETKENHDPEKLINYLKLRSVSRKSFQKITVQDEIIDKINALLDSGFQCNLHSSKAQKSKIIKINQLGTQIRLMLEECHKVHCHILQWKDEDAQFGIPFTAAGLNKSSANLFKLMHKRWPLIRFFNKYLGSAYLSSVEMDYIPGKNSAGYLSLKGEKSFNEMSTQELILQGRQIQRIWLYLTKRNIMVQPCYIPMALNYHLKNEVTVSSDYSIKKKLNTFKHLYQSCGFDDKTLFIARIGYSKTPDVSVRSTRLPLNQLILSPEHQVTT